MFVADVYKPLSWLLQTFSFSSHFFWHLLVCWLCYGFVMLWQSTMRVNKKTAPFYYCNNFVKPRYIWVIFLLYHSKFPT